MREKGFALFITIVTVLVLLIIGFLGFGLIKKITDRVNSASGFSPTSF